MAKGCFLVAALAVALGRPAAGVDLSTRHLESQINSEFRLTGVPFDEYINAMRRIVAKARLDLAPERRLQIIDANSPFEWRPAGPECRQPGQARFRRGALLIHGLSDSPYQMRDLAKFFLQRCYLVRAILLPGHGTVPGDLLSVTFQEWIKATRYAVDSFVAGHEVERLVVAGFSTGGTLAIYEGLTQEPVDALVLFSPAVKLKTNLGFMANWHKAISWADKEKRWIDIAPDEDYAKYESFTFNAADQIYLLTKRLDSEAGTNKVRIPIFMALSEDDATIDAADGIAFFKTQSNPNSRLIVYSNSVEKSDDSRIERRRSAYPEFDILNFAHLSVHISPQNPHYGRNGDYKNCLHYLDDAPKWKACKEGRGEIKYGELSKDALNKYILRRLSYNPDFEGLMMQLDTFLKSVN